MKLASIEVINFFEQQQNSPAIGVIRFQILKSSTSAAANYRAACRARSKKEFYAKLCIVVEETDETLFWLEILHDSNIETDKTAVTTLGKEWQEILMIVAKARANTNV
jgi:four helix bundle protein